MPGIVRGQLILGLAELAAACDDLWHTGAAGETLGFERL